MSRSRLWLLTVIVVLGLGAAPTAASARVPQGFVGMMADGPLFDPGVNLPRQLDRMVASGVESLRVSFSWAAAQPYQSWADVPAGQTSAYQNVNGVPTSFAATDQIVGLAARRRLPVLPVVLYAPAWDLVPNTNGFGIPQTNGPYAAYLQALVQRYGPAGSYWSQNPGIPRLPIRMWQIWNEPNLDVYWPTQPFPASYVALLRAAHAAIKSADPGAKIVLAGMPDRVWEDLGLIYRVRGARQLFDIVAVHPYTTKPAGVITILEYVRAAMNRAGDAHKPIIASEVSWPSSLGKSSQHFGFETNEAGQARNTAAVLPLLASNRQRLGLLGFYYYTWVGDEYHDALSFDFAGLFRFSAGRVVTKPAFAAFESGALALDGCRVKGSVATRCVKTR